MTLTEADLRSGQIQSRSDSYIELVWVGAGLHSLPVAGVFEGR